MCADSLLAEGQSLPALAIYRRMAEPSNGTWIRIAAYRGLIKAEREKAVSHIVTLLKDNDINLQRAAGKLIAETPGTAVTEALAQQIPSLNTDGKIVLLAALEGRGDLAAAPYVAKAVTDADAGVGVAAVRALGVIGRAADVALLAEISAEGGQLDKAARNSLARMSAPGIGSALVDVAKGDGEIQPRGSRRLRPWSLASMRPLAPRCSTVAGDGDRTVRQAAYKALGVVGRPEGVCRRWFRCS